jgi:hypothetical protein
MAHTLDLKRLDEVFDYLLEEQETRLSKSDLEWVRKFKSQWDDRHWLSDTQLEILEKIYVRY